MELIYEKSQPGRRAGRVPSYGLPVPNVPAELRRHAPPRLPEVPENEIVRHFTALAAYAKERVGLPVAFERPHFKEVAFRTPIPARDVVARAREHGVHPGYALGRDYPGLDDVLLVALTERRTPADVDRLAEVLAEVTG